MYVAVIKIFVIDICDVVSNALHVYKTCAAIWWEIEVNRHYSTFISNVDAIKVLIITSNNSKSYTN